MRGAARLILRRTATNSTSYNRSIVQQLPAVRHPQGACLSGMKAVGRGRSAAA